MRPIRQLARVALLAALIPASGCVFKGGSDAVSSMDLPRRGQPLSAESWKLVESEPARGGSSQLVWALPIMMSGHSWVFDRDASRGNYQSFSWFDLGPLIVSLPLYIASEDRDFEREPAATTRDRLVWHPLLASASSTGREGEPPRLRASGVPLLWSRVAIRNDRFNSEMRIATHLWSLGPALIRLKVAPPPREEGLEPQEGRMYLFAPLALGGGPGLLLWSSYRMQSPGGSVTGHGPLVGLLGYGGSKTRQQVGTDESSRWWLERRRHRLAGGMLWYSAREGREGGRIRDARNGPILGIIGWGRKNYAPAIQLLWVKIPLGKQHTEEPKEQ